MAYAVKPNVTMKLWREKKLYPMMILKTMITRWKNSFNQKRNDVPFADYREGSWNFITSKVELFMTIVKAGNGQLLS